jgi:hypothetical protein
MSPTPTTPASRPTSAAAGWRAALAEPVDPVLLALRRAGSRIREVRYRENRTVLLSVSRDGRVLNSHACFRHAPPGIAGAVATFVTSRTGTRAARGALEELRQWEGTRTGLARARQRKPRRVKHVNGPDTARLRRLFDRFNEHRFGAALPDVPLRISRRMTRSLGTITYGTGSLPRVKEIAISADLLLEENRTILEDTLLHEMAHAEAWLRTGHKGHGAPWRRVAERVGCTPRALTKARIKRRKG